MSLPCVYILCHIPCSTRPRQSRPQGTGMAVFVATKRGACLARLHPAHLATISAVSLGVSQDRTVSLCPRSQRVEFCAVR
jgi:hypothetical protein